MLEVRTKWRQLAGAPPLLSWMVMRTNKDHLVDAACHALQRRLEKEHKHTHSPAQTAKESYQPGDVQLSIVSITVKVNFMSSDGTAKSEHIQVKKNWA